jgi:hypothetical protein
LKLQQAKNQQHQAEEDRLVAAHVRNRSAMERNNAKTSRRQRSTDECSSNDGLQQMAALAASQEQEVCSVKSMFNH